MRTRLSVLATAASPVERIDGSMGRWAFRPHFHVGDELVRIQAGRARFRLGAQDWIVGGGDEILVLAGQVHRFEPVDEAGWAFRSEFHAHDGTAVPVGPLVSRVERLLSRRPSLHSDIDALARACSLSSGYLAREFRRETGTSLHNFHVLVALHRAKALLKSDGPLVDAALGAGFYDQAHLTREFVRTFGMTPGSFRSAWSSATPSALAGEVLRDERGAQERARVRA